MSWPRVPLKYLYRRQKSLGSGKEMLLSIYRDHGVIPKDSRDDNFNKASDDLSKYQIVHVDDLVVNKMKAWQGSVAVSKYDGIISPAYFVYSPIGEIYPRFSHYLLRSDEYFRYYGSISLGIRPNQWDLDPAEFDRMLVTVPSLAEQRQIADYLDRETAEIDDFITDQELFISLTQERTVAETYAIATGQSLSQTRVQSISTFWRDLPVDWTLQKIGWHFSIRNGSTPKSDQPRYWDDDGFPWLNSSVVNHRVVTEPSRRVSETALAELHLPIIEPGSLLIGITGQGKTRGLVTEVAIRTTINQHVAALTARDGRAISTRFLHLALSAAYGDLRFLSDGNGGTKGALTVEMLQHYYVPVPPPNVQPRLVQEWDTSGNASAEMESDANRAIVLAKERRSALISAAVTGQIDVANPHSRRKPAVEQIQDELEAS